jgi:hypothetical protein
MRRITLDRGVKVATYSPPPRGFDAIAASAVELAKHGFPARPEHPELLDRYKRQFGQIKNRFNRAYPVNAYIYYIL